MLTISTLGCIFAQIYFMKLQTPLSVEWLATFLDAKLIGNSTQLATGINEIHKVVPGDISFVDVEKYFGKCLNSAATIILINKEVVCPEGKTLLVCADPFSAYIKLVKQFAPFQKLYTPISETAVIGAETHLQPGVVVGNNVRIGSNCLIHPNVTIYDNTIIGDHVIIQANTVIGGDAFYFKTRSGKDLKFEKMESCGRVIIEDHVEIGSSCTIDKGVSGDTIIGAGSKLDNQIHIGHGVVIGKNVLIAAQVGVAGKTIIEDDVILWGQVGVNKSLTIGKGAVVNGQSGVTVSIAGGKTYFGTPAIEAKEKLKEMAWVRRIPEMWDKLTK
jgi:UDP-3-O-[3-hydroxymyristoyl] glucosamine N-acyltransferase